LPNEPKAVQCLPRFLKNKVLTNRIRIDQNRIKTHLKASETDTNEARIIPISPVRRGCSGGGTPKPPVYASPIGLAQPVSRFPIRVYSCPSVVKNIFWKNEAKLCPSLLTIVKKTNPKRTQIKP
jgi:hypothetical protein